MKASTAVQALKLLGSEGLLDPHGVSINFFGGEPLMNFGTLRSVVNHAEEWQRESGMPMSFNCTTNGLALKDEKVDFVIDHDIKLVISIDGEEGIHNEGRRTAAGGPSHQKIMYHTKKLLASRPDLVTARATVTPEHLDLVALDEYFTGEGIEDYGFDIVFGTRADGTTFWTEDDLDRLDAAYGRYVHHHLGLLLSGTTRGHGVRYLLSRLMRIHHRQRLPIPCRMGRELVAVSPEGSFFPCHWLVGNGIYSIGNVLRGIDIDLLRSSYPTPVWQKQSCAGCWARFLCDGACAAVSLLEFGNDQSVSRCLCADRAIAWKWTLWLYIALSTSGFTWPSTSGRSMAGNGNA